MAATMANTNLISDHVSALTVRSIMLLFVCFCDGILVFKKHQQKNPTRKHMVLKPFF